MSYKILTQELVEGYIREIREISDYLGTGELEISEIGDGNLNFVYIVKKGAKSVILKQAVPYLRCAGESWPLSRERMSYEIRALKAFKTIACENIPDIFYFDEEMSLVIMEYLDNHIIMRKGLMEAKRYPLFAEHISTFLANSLFKTSSLFLSSNEKRKLMGRFNTNTELCKITEDFVFTFPYMQHDSNNINPEMEQEHIALMQDSEFKKGILKLKYLFMNRSDALLHGDLHTGSIMLNDKETYVIDPEFAFFGPFGFDIGALIANLIQSYVSHFQRSKDAEFREWLLKTIEEIYAKFEEKFLSIWAEEDGNNALIISGFADEDALNEYKKEFMKNIFQESIGFAGAKMARRLFGIAGVEDILGIEDLKSRAEVEKKSLEIAKQFVKRYENINSVQEMTDIIKSVG